MTLLLVAWRLLRYRVAVMLVLFMLLGVAVHRGLDSASWTLLLAVVSLALSYISATSVNDLADYKIDAINHAKSPGRPLITGEAQQRDIWLVFGVSSGLAVASALVINYQAALVMLAAVCINVIYSLPPVRLSYRTFLAPLCLGLGYVCVPYLLGVMTIDQHITTVDLRWMFGLYLLFVGRIILKDFRDRKGDAKYHKPTFLLRFGKTATCLCSALFIAAGGVMIALQVCTLPWLVVGVGLYIAAILAMLYRLKYATEGQDEQLSIGVGAKMGNGLLITLVTAYTLIGASIDRSTIITATGLITGLFFLNFILFLQNPKQAVIGYKG